MKVCESRPTSQEMVKRLVRDGFPRRGKVYVVERPYRSRGYALRVFGVKLGADLYTYRRTMSGRVMRSWVPDDGSAKLISMISLQDLADLGDERDHLNDL